MLKVVKVCVRTYGGKEANIEGSAGRQVILATVMKGLLQHTRECKTVPSLINAPFLSQELGIETVIDDKVCTVSCRRRVPFRTRLKLCTVSYIAKCVTA